MLYTQFSIKLLGCPLTSLFSARKTVDGTRFGQTIDGTSLNDVQVANHANPVQKPTVLDRYDDIVKSWEAAYQRIKVHYNLRHRLVSVPVWCCNYALFDVSKFCNATLAPKCLGSFFI